MKRLTIHETRNGCIIVDGDTESLSILGTIHNSWSYATPQEASILEDAEAESERAESDCDKAKTEYERVLGERRKVFLGHTPDPPSCLEPLEITKGG